MASLDEVHEALTNLNTASPWAFVLAALAGILLVATPSVLAMVPVIIGYVAAEPGIRRGKAVTRSLAFLLGTATTFGSYGLIFGWAGSRLAGLFGATRSARRFPMRRPNSLTKSRIPSTGGA